MKCTALRQGQPVKSNVFREIVFHVPIHGNAFSGTRLMPGLQGCKAECPSAVDMAKLKYEFCNTTTQVIPKGHPFRDYLFAYIGLARFGYAVAPLSIYLWRYFNPGAGERLLRPSRNRRFPN
jgi:hypothetical protein